MAGYLIMKAELPTPDLVIVRCQGTTIVLADDRLGDDAVAALLTQDADPGTGSIMDFDESGDTDTDPDASP